MADQRAFHTGISGFGQVVDQPSRSPVSLEKELGIKSARTQKVETLRNQKGAKALALGSPEFLHEMATAERQGNEQANEEFVRDMRMMNGLQISLKYGEEVAANQNRFNESVRDLEAFKASERDTGEVIGDTVKSINQGVLNFGADVVVNPVLSAYDSVGSLTGAAPVAPAFGAIMDDYNEFVQSTKSPRAQADARQEALETQLNTQDNEATYEAEVAEGKVLSPGLNKVVRDAVDTATNLADSPIAMGEFAAQNASTLIPMASGIQAIGRARALNVLKSRGVVGDDAAKFLKTSEGKDLLQKEMTDSVPAVSALVEGGSSMSQAQTEIMGMDEASLTGVAEYDALREEGMTHERAQLEMASTAGNVAAGVGGVAGALTGQLAKGFEANPLKVGTRGKSGAAALEVASTVGKETVEEASQELANQVATNVGVDAAGIDTDILADAGQAIALGALGGASTAGALQAPGAVIGTVSETARAAVSAGKAGFAKRMENIKNKEDAASPVGSVAQVKAAEATSAAASEIVNPTPNQDTPNTPTSADETLVQETVREAIYVPDEYAAQLAESAPVFKEILEKNGGIDRHSIVAVYGDLLNQEGMDTKTKVDISLGILDASTKARMSDSDAVTDALSRLPEDHKDRKAHEALKASLSTLESSPAVVAARTMIEDLTPEDVAEKLDFEDIKAGNFDTPAAKNTLEALEIIARYNPTAADLSQYDIVLEQVQGGMGDNSLLRKSLETARSLVAEMQEADARTANIVAEQADYIESLPEADRNKAGHRKYHNRDEVSKDIIERGNSNNQKLSLVQHRQKFEEARSSGQLKEAQDALQELRNFAVSQINKIGAYNASATEGKGARKSFQAYGNGAFYTENENKPFVNAKSSYSVATAMGTHVDTGLLVSLYNSLLTNFGDELGSLEGDLASGPLEVPALHPSIKFNKTQKTKKVEEAPTKTPELVAEPDTDIEIDVIEDDVTPSETTPEQTKEDPPVEEPFEAEPEVEEIQEDPSTTEAEVIQADEQEPDNVIEDAPETEATLPDAMPNMVKDSNGRNRFLESFKRVSNKSSLLDLEDVTAHVLENTPDLTEKEQAALKGLMVRVIPHMSEVVEKVAFSELKKTRGGKRAGSRVSTWLADLRSGEKDVLSYNNALPLNFLTRREDGKAELDPRVMQAAGMAMLEWIMENGTRSQPFVDDETVGKRLGLTPGTTITTEMRTAVRSGAHLQSVIDTVARKSVDLLGVTPNHTKSLNYTQGMFRALAANMIEAFGNENWIDVSGRDVIIGEDKDGEPITRTYITVSTPEEGRGAKAAELLKATPDVFTQALVGQPEKLRYVNEPPTTVPRTQLRNKFTKLSKAEAKAVDRLQQMPFKFNTPLVDFADALGKDNILKVLGYKEVDPTRTNKRHAESLDGKNTALLSGWNGVEGYKTAAGGTPEALSDASVYFQWAVSSTGRMFQQGPVTPQGNKYARELMTTTNTTLDLTDLEHQDMFWLTIAQALDISVEKQQHQKSIDAAVTAMNDPDGLKPAADLIQDWLKTGEIDGDAFVDAVSSAVDDEGAAYDVTMKLVHALTAVARMRNADEAGKKSFEMSLALEADGKTDGPINAIMHMTHGEFTPGQIKLLAKGGIYFTDERMSLNDYLEQDRTDLYQVAAKVLESELAQKFGDAEAFESEREKEQAIKTLVILDAFLPDFGLTQDANEVSTTLEVGRSITKNPLTTFLYGAGVEGISQKITDTVLSELYKTLTEVAGMVADGDIKDWTEHPKFAGRDDLIGAMQTVFDTSVATSGDWSFSVNTKNPTNFNELFGSPTTAQVSFKAQKNIAQSIERFFGQPLTTAVDTATGGLANNMKFTQKISQIQATIFQDAYKKLYKTKHAERVADGSINKGQYLSRNDMEKIFSEAMKLAPIYETDAQSFHVSSAESYDSDKRISASFTDKLSSGGTVPTPSDAGVKVSPYMTIGTGDGRMILNIYTDANGDLDTSLAVFDGVELAATNIYTGSEQINQSVYKAWMEGNIYKTMLESFDAFLPNVDLKTLEPETLKQLSRIAQLPKGEIFTRHTLQGFRDQLMILSDQSEARKTAMKQVTSWTDHMASANSPYGSVEGKQAISHGGKYDSALVAAELNKLYDAALINIKANRTTSNQTPAIQPATEGLANLIEAVGESLPEYGAHKVTGSQLLAFMSEPNEFGSEQANLFWDVLKKDPTFKEFTFFFGEGQGLETLRDEQYPNLPKKPVQAGQLFAGAKVAFIANASPETLLHEVLHAHTATKLIDHYKNPEGSPEYLASAITRLETLMGEFERMDLSEQSDPVREAGQILQGELARLEGKDAVKVSEFISWMLSNQNLIGFGKQQKVRGSIYEMARKAMTWLKDMLGITNTPGITMFSNIRFNTEILVAEPVEAKQAESDQRTDEILEQVYGSNPEIGRIEKRYLGRLQKFNAQARGDGSKRDQAKYAKRVADNKSMAIAAAEHVKAQGFSLDPRETLAFQAVHATLMSGMELNAAAMREVNRMYGHAVKTLEVEDFIQDGKNADSVELSLAAMRHGVLTGDAGLRKTADGRTDLLATFMALSQVSPEFRQALSKLKAPKNVDKFERSIDGALDGAAATITNYLSQLPITYKGNRKTSIGQLEVLSDILSEIDGERRFLADVNAMKPIDTMNDYLADKIEKGSAKASKFFRGKAEASMSKFAKVGFQAAGVVAALGSAKESDVAGETLTRMMNHTPKMHMARKALADLRGMTASNADLMRLTNVVKSAIDGMRQDYREVIPEELAKAFTRKLDRKEWGRLFVGLAQTDVSSLGRADAFRLVKDPKKLSAAIKAAETKLGKLGGKDATVYREKAKALATYMTTKEVTSTNLLRNADAIAALLGETRQETDAVTPELVKTIDQLVSLYAYDQTGAVTKANLAELAKTEEKGVRLLLGYHASTRAMEIDRKAEGDAGNISLYNGWKGYIPETTRQGESLIVADDVDNASLVRRGYVRVADYVGDGAERYKGKRGYYQSSVGGRAAFRQGVAQTVHATWQGVDVRTGQSRTGNTAGMVVGPAAKRIKQALGAPKNGLVSSERLMPVYGVDGTVTAYERPMGANRLTALQRDNHLGRMLGVWSGRILEETEADRFNKDLVKTMKSIYDEQGQDRKREFVNIAGKGEKDAVYRDAWNSLGWKIKEDIAEEFGEADFFPIRRDMIEDAVGYRAASITDPWDGTTRWSDTTKNNLVTAATALIGKDAYKRLKQGEGIVTDFVSYAKTNIIIRSVVVMWGNIVSNGLHLMTWGIGPVDMAKGMRSKFLEITQYVENKEKILGLTTQLAAETGNAVKTKRIKAQLLALEDANARLSIKPLIDAGEFSTVSENLTEEDLAIREGKIVDYLEKAVDKLPGWASDVGKNLLITKDTSMFKILNRMVQYGDFVAKAVLYDHLTQNKDMSQQEIMDVIAEEFVNYNRLPGRDRDYLESVGLMWFYNYKLRIQKIAAKMIRERPVSALMFAGGAGPMFDIDTVTSGSLVGGALDGRLGFSIGPEMGLNSWTLNPWYNLTQ